MTNGPFESPAGLRDFFAKSNTAPRLGPKCYLWHKVQGYSGVQCTCGAKLASLKSDSIKVNVFPNGNTILLIFQRNITSVANPGVRDTILNLTLTALAPKFVLFEPQDFQLWFHRNLAPVMASLHPGSLEVIPRNISCASYEAM